MVESHLARKCLKTAIYEINGFTLHQNIGYRSNFFNIETSVKDPEKTIRFFFGRPRSKSFVAPGFILQIYSHKSDHLVRFGCTCSKKVGNAVARNRAKRRLREIARLVYYRKWRGPALIMY